MTSGPWELSNWFDRSSRTGLSRSAKIGVLALVAVLTQGSLAVLLRPESWVARTTLIVLPPTDLPGSDVGGFYEVLGQGQIVATIAEILDLPSVQDVAAETAGLEEGQRAGVDVSVAVVPDTSLLRVVVEGPSAEAAAGMARAMATASQNYVRQLPQPFRVEPVGPAEPEVGAGGTSTVLLLGLVAALAVVVGLIAQQAFLLLERTRKGRARTGLAAADGEQRPGGGAADLVVGRASHRERPGMPGTAARRTGSR